MATLYMDMQGGNNSNSGADFANRFQDFTNGATAARTAPGDTIRIMASRKSVLADADWTNNSNTVTLDAAVTAVITNCESNWTASTNVTCALDTSNEKEGTNCQSIAIASGFTTGLAAYFATGTLDLSGYQQISFWVRPNAAVSAGVLRINLCSDTAGATPVDSFDLPALSTTRWHEVTIDKAANLGSAIESIALYAVSDPGTVTVLLDHIIACKDKTSSTCLTLSHVVRKTGTKALFPIRSIDGTTLTLDTSGAVSTSGSNGLGFSGTTETADLIAYMPVHMNIATQTLNESGTVGSPITYEGGYNRTDMSSITDADELTVIDALNQNVSFTTTSRDYMVMKNIVFVRYNQAWSGGTTANRIVLDNCHIVFCANGLGTSGSQIPFCDSTIYLSSCGGYSLVAIFVSSTLEFHSGVAVATRPSLAGYLFECVVRAYSISVEFNAVVGSLVEVTSSGLTSGVCLSCLAGTNVRINSGTLAGGTFGVSLVRSSNLHFRNVTNSCSTEVDITNFPSFVEAKDHDATPDNHKGWTAFGTWTSQTSVRHTASGIAWQVNPTSTNATEDTPVIMPIDGGILCVAGEEVTASVWMRRTNTGLTGKLVCRGGQIAGVASDVEWQITEVADTWEEIPIAFTPTENGVVNLEIHAYGGTTYSLYVDDFAVTSA